MRESRNLFWSSRCSQDQVVKVMKEVFVRTNYLLDPHTAVAKYVADEYASCQHQEDVTLVVYSTGMFAHKCLEGAVF
jgi:threonine synthase